MPVHLPAGAGDIQHTIQPQTTAPATETSRAEATAFDAKMHAEHEGSDDDSSELSFDSDDRAGLEQDSDEILAKAKQAYQADRLFHGTSASSKARLQESGFSLEGKTGGATAPFLAHAGGSSQDHSGLSHEASNGHYLTSEHRYAGEYAKLADRRHPAIVRTIGVRQDPGVEHDRYGIQPTEAQASDPRVVALLQRYRDSGVRTTSDVPSEAVLGSKHSRPSVTEGARFQHALRASDVGDLSDETAAELLRAVQSDSDDDFPRRRR